MESGADFVRVVATLVTAFQKAAEVLEVIRDRKDKKKRKRDKEIEELLELELLYRSLVAGGSRCHRHCKSRKQQYGRPFEHGDLLALSALKDIVIALQTEVIQPALHARAVETAALDITVLHECSITSCKDATTAMDQLCQRITMADQYQWQLPQDSMYDAPRPSMTSLRPGTAYTEPAGLMEAHRKAGMTSSATDKSLPSLPSSVNSDACVINRTVPRDMLQRAQTIFYPGDSSSQRSWSASTQAPSTRQHLPRTALSSQTNGNDGYAGAGFESGSGGHKPRMMNGQTPASPSSSISRTSSIQAPSFRTSSITEGELNGYNTTYHPEVRSTSAYAPQPGLQQWWANVGLREVPSTASLHDHQEAREPATDDPPHWKLPSPSPSQMMPHPLQHASEGSRSVSVSQIALREQASPFIEGTAPSCSEFSPRTPHAHEEENMRKLSARGENDVAGNSEHWQRAESRTGQVYSPNLALEVKQWREPQPVQNLRKPDQAATSQADAERHYQPLESYPAQMSFVIDDGSPQPLKSHPAPMSFIIDDGSFAFDTRNASPPEPTADPMPSDTIRQQATPHLTEPGPDAASHHKEIEVDQMSILSHSTDKTEACEMLPSPRAEKFKIVAAALEAPEAMRNSLDPQFREKMRPVADLTNEKFSASLTQADYQDRLSAVPKGQENAWLPLARPAMHNRYHGFCKGAWQIRKAPTDGLQVLLTPSLKVPILHWRCSACSFQSKAPNADTLPDYILFNQKHNIRYRWLFLAKSHQRVETSLDTPENYSYGCILCAAQNQITASYDKLDHLLMHIMTGHKVAMITPEVKTQTRCIVGPIAGQTQEWDINLPESKSKGSGTAADEFFMSASRFWSRRKGKK